MKETTIRLKTETLKQLRVYKAVNDCKSYDEVIAKLLKDNK